MELVSDYVVCEEGKPLSPEAARILVSSFGLLSAVRTIFLDYFSPILGMG